MKNPEFFLLPILMFADYILTVFGAIQREKKYAEHFKIQDYELNPLWQKDISKKKWFNPRHILFTVLFTAILSLLIEFGNLPDFFIQGFLGCLIVSFGCLIGRHLSNILIFNFLIKNPSSASGQIAMTHTLILHMSKYQCLVIVIPMTLTTIFSATPFIIGGLTGSIFILCLHSIWIGKYKREMETAKLDVGKNK